MRKDCDIQLVKRQITRFWQLKKVIVIPIAVVALGSIKTKFEKFIESLRSELNLFN